MSEVYPVRTRFNSGVISPSALGQVNLPQYAGGLVESTNWIPMLQGSLRRRCGSTYVVPAKQTAAVRLVGFKYSPTQSYILEFGAGYIRFYKDRAQILSGASPYEISSPFTQSELFQLSFAQSYDYMYIASPSRVLYTLKRFGHTSWTLAATTFVEPPYGNVNLTTTGIAVAAATSPYYTLTASASLFTAADVGKYISISQSGTPDMRGVFIVTAYTDATHVTATLAGSPYQTQTSISSWSSSTDWRISVSPQVTAVALFGGRLWLAGFADDPARVSASMSGDFSSFAYADDEGNTLDTSAITLALYATGISGSQQAYWMTSLKGGIAVGTASNEWLITSGSATASTLTPDSSVAEPHGSSGSAAGLQAYGEGYRVFHISKDSRQLVDFSYDIMVEGYEDNLASSLANHILDKGVTCVAKQSTPLLNYWFVTTDGQLIAMAFNAKEKYQAWHPHTLGGSGVVTSVECILNPTLSSDDVWIAVKRTINGASVQYIEYIGESFGYNTDAEDAICVDCSTQYYNATPFTTLSGLSYLEGKTVKALVDGAEIPDKVVSSGAIDLGVSANTVVVGLPMVSRAVLTNFFVTNNSGFTNKASYQKITNVIAEVYRSYGLQVGMTDTTLEELCFHKTDSVMGDPPELITGYLDGIIESEFTREANLILYNDSTFPTEILSLTAGIDVGDK